MQCKLSLVCAEVTAGCLVGFALSSHKAVNT